MKKVISLLLFLSLLLGVSIPALAAGPKTETMRVHLEEGAVTVRDAGGVALPFSENMPLCSGCSVETGDDGSAYISLDDCKVIQLDRNTSVTVNQSGRRIQVKLTAGQLDSQTQNEL